ncbi:MAG TPA: MFS transporter [Thermoflexia bacterium]|nr:MFS transporter [Thermoflexia bacterium]
METGVLTSSRRATAQGFRTFLVIWAGQLVSLVGSGLTGFALGVWVYQRTGSVTQFALISLSTALPGILFSPIAGALVDRWDRRWAMILSDVGAGLCTLAMAVLLLLNRLQVWHIYIAMAVSSAFSAFQWPAYSATTTLLVPQKHLGRASGMVQLGQALAQIVSPTLAGVLMGIIRIQGVILIDFATFLFAVFTLAMVRIPRPPTTEEGKAGEGSLLREAAYGWTYIRARPGLLGLLFFFAAANFVVGIVGVLFTPLVLSFTTTAVLGLLLSVGGGGFLTGSLAMSIWGGPKRRVYGVLGFNLLLGTVLFAAGFPPRAWILGVAAFLAYFSLPMINGCSQAIWQGKVAPDVQGRVFAVRRMVAWASLPLAYLAAGPLADRVFEPLMAEGGLLAGSVGRVIGVGVGRGIGLLYILLGGLLLLTTAVAYLYPRLREVERELPDVVVEDGEVVRSSPSR